MKCCFRAVTVFVIFSVLSSSLYSQNVQTQESSGKDVPAVTLSEGTETEKLSKEEKKLAKEALRQQKEAEDQALKDKENEKTDSYLGIVYVPVKNHTIESGRLKVVLNDRAGTFNIYVLNNDGREYPLFTDTDDSRNSYFSVRTDNTVYRLNESAGIRKTVRKLYSGSAQLEYVLKNNFQVVVDFTPVSSSPDSEADIIKMTVYVTNISNSEKEKSLAVKAVFDTFLGEGSQNHFVTSSGISVDRERILSVPDEASDVISSNGYNSVQFVLAGNTVSKPETAALLNRKSVSASSWTPTVIDSRSFNTVLSYNNSAVSLSWPSANLGKGKTDKIVFYIAAASDGLNPAGIPFVESLEDDSIQNEEKINEAESSVSRSDIDFIVPPVTENQLDYEYIQNLIDRINALQSDPDAVDRVEIRKLNSELDAILEKIRQMQ